MIDLKTMYMGIELKNPIIIGASNLVKDFDNLKRLEEAGAAAIVYKSLFEEQIQLETLEMEEGLGEYENRNAEMQSLFPSLQHAGPKEHLMYLEKAKKAINIPLFASLNAVSHKSWIEYAKKVEETGVDGIELNFYSAPLEIDNDGGSIINDQLAIIKEVKNNVGIPISVKLSPYYANPLNVISQMDKTDVDAFVLFNRLFQPEIDIEEEANKFPWNLSHEGDNRLPLRFTGLLYNNVNANICANTGILNANHVAQMVLAGADAVQVVSTLYRNKIEYISTILEELENWMQIKDYKTLADFKGKLSKKNSKDNFAYKRAQYVDILFNSDDIFKKYPLR